MTLERRPLLKCRRRVKAAAAAAVAFGLFVFSCSNDGYAMAMADSELSYLFGEGVRSPEAQGRTRAAIQHGLQTRDAEMALGRLLGDLTER